MPHHGLPPNGDTAGPAGGATPSVLSVQGTVGGVPIPVSATFADPSVGANGSPAPTSSTQIGGPDASGNLQAAQVLSSAPTGTEEALVVRPLPIVGAATAANQATEITSLASILANQTNGTQETAITNFPATQPISALALPLPAGAATSANQNTELSSLASILANQTNGTQEVQVTNFPATQPISGTVTANQGAAASASAAWPVEQTDGAGTVIGTAAHPTRIDPTGTTPQPISATSLPLPTGAATQTTLAAILTNQTNGTQEVQVTNLPATQPVSGTVTANQGTAASASAPWPVEQTDGAGNIIGTSSHPTRVDPTGTTTQPVSLQAGSAAIGNQTDYQTTGNLTAGGQAVTTAQLNGVGSLTVQVAGTWTAAGGLLLQVCDDNSNWVSTNYRPDNSTNTSTAISANNIGRVAFGGHGYFRLLASGAMTGTAVVTIRASAAVSFITLVEPLPAGTATIGGVTGTGTSGTPAGSVLSTQTPTTSATTSFVGNGAGTPVSMIGARGCGCHIGVPTGTSPSFTLTPQYSMDGTHYYNSTFLDPIAGTAQATLTITNASSDQAWVIRTPAGCQSIQLVSSAFSGTGSPTLSTTLYTSQCTGNYQ